MTKKGLFIALATIALAYTDAFAQKVWSSKNGTLTFVKQGFADWTLAANQDRISDSVWITRKSTQALFNIRLESGYTTPSPVGTEWALGTTASYATLTYSTFITLAKNDPASLIGKDLVLHLKAENIYLDFKLLTYGSGSTGADFSYVRAAGVTSVGGTSTLPTFDLESNYPNPFNPGTEIRYSLSSTGPVQLRVYDLVGRELATLVNGVQPAGRHTAHFTSTSRASGMYVVRLQTGEGVKTRTMIQVK